MKNIFLSHNLSTCTPAYAGGKGIEIKKIKSMCNGDSCNQLQFSMTNHIGTHVDAPSHFVKDGKTITDYDPDDWIFNHCCLIDIPCQPGQVINAESISSAVLNYDCDLLIVRTGFESYRKEVRYWRQSPVFHKDLGEYFVTNFTNLKAIAFDCISLSSLTDRNMGRDAHKEILGRGIRIFEDVKLSHLESVPVKVLAFPLLLEHSDGSQVTIIATIK